MGCGRDKLRVWDQQIQTTTYKIDKRGFPGGAVVKNQPANSGTWVQALVQEDPTCRSN